MKGIIGQSPQFQSQNPLTQQYQKQNQGDILDSVIQSNSNKTTSNRNLHDYEDNAKNFYMGMTPTLETKAKYPEYKKILDAYERAQLNNPGLGQNIHNVENPDQYNKNINLFYDASDNNQQLQSINYSPENNLSDLQYQKDLQKYKEVQQQIQQQQQQSLQQQQQQINLQQSSQIPGMVTEKTYNIQNPLYSNNSTPQRTANQYIYKVQKPYYSGDTKPIKHFVITDSDNKIRDHVNHYLINKQIDEYEVFSVPGSSLSLFSQKQFSESYQQCLIETLKVLEQMYTIKEISLFDSINNKSFSVVSDNQIQRNQLREAIIESQMKFKKFFQQNTIFEGKVLKGFLIDIRGNPEKII